MVINDKRLTINNYELVIGLEVHVELNTKSKMFCRCSAEYFGKEPNTHTCSVCLGLPGAVPMANGQAIEGCMKIGLALNCEVADESLFERKNYFYPDLPKGYQISQYRWPLCIGGWLMVDGKNGQQKIRINRVHQEEDTGKLMHADGETLIDYNRSGVPLVEIVTEPDFKDSESVRDFAKKLQQIFRYLGVSNADMERGDMRLEANVSVRKVGQKELPKYRIELKNINSFRFMVAAIEYEFKRQVEELKQGRTLTQETRGWNEDKRQTYLQRKKEEANDYRYFPDPDLPEFRIKNDELRIKEEIPELPTQKIERFMADYGLGKDQALILTERADLADCFEGAVSLGKKDGVTPQQIANHIINQKITPDKITPDQIVGNIKSKTVGIIDDEKEIERIADEVIAENTTSVEAYKKGKTAAMQALIGAAMRKTQGKVNVEKIKTVLTKKLS